MDSMQQWGDVASCGIGQSHSCRGRNCSRRHVYMSHSGGEGHMKQLQPQFHVSGCCLINFPYKINMLFSNDIVHCDFTFQIVNFLSWYKAEVSARQSQISNFSIFWWQLFCLLPPSPPLLRGKSSARAEGTLLVYCSIKPCLDRELMLLFLFKGILPHSVDKHWPSVCNVIVYATNRWLYEQLDFLN